MDSDRYLMDQARKQFRQQIISAFHKIAANLKSQFPKVRVIERDGNSFYRAVMLSYLEQVIYEGELALEELIAIISHEEA